MATDASFNQKLAKVSLGERFWIKAVASTGCEDIVDQVKIKVYPNNEKDTAIDVTLLETSPNSLEFRSLPEGIKVLPDTNFTTIYEEGHPTGVRVGPGNRIIVRKGIRGTSLLVSDDSENCKCVLDGYEWHKWRPISTKFVLKPKTGMAVSLEKPYIPISVEAVDYDLLELRAKKIENSGKVDPCYTRKYLENKDQVEFSWKITGKGTFKGGGITSKGDAVIYQPPSKLRPGETFTATVSVTAYDGQAKGNDLDQQRVIQMSIRRSNNYKKPQYFIFENVKVNQADVSPQQSKPQGTNCDCDIQTTWQAGEALKGGIKSISPMCDDEMTVLEAYGEDFDDLFVSTSNKKCVGDTTTIQKIPDTIHWEWSSKRTGDFNDHPEGQKVVFSAAPLSTNETIKIKFLDDVENNQYDDLKKEYKQTIQLQSPLRLALVADGGDHEDASSTEKWAKQADKIAKYLHDKGFNILRLTVCEISEITTLKNQVVMTYKNLLRPKRYDSDLFENAISLLVDKFKKDSPITGDCCNELFIYFQGHGSLNGFSFYTDKRWIDGVNYPKKVPRKPKKKNIYDELDKLPKQTQVTIFLDACHSGAIYYANGRKRIEKFCDNHCGITIITTAQKGCVTETYGMVKGTATSDFLNAKGGIREKFLAMKDATFAYATEYGGNRGFAECFTCPGA